MPRTLSPSQPSEAIKIRTTNCCVPAREPTNAAHLEAHFVDILLQLAAMHQPVNKSTALKLINSLLVETAQLQDYIVEWKEKHLPQNKLVGSNSNAYEEHGAYLGDKYWQNFLSRHEELKTKTAVRFNSN